METQQANKSTQSRPRSRLGPLLLLAAVLVILAVQKRPSGEPPGWSTDLEAARIEAADTNRPLLLAFSMIQCGPCAAMDTTVLPSDEVKAVLKDFVPVFLDVDRQGKVAKQFDVYATPTYAVIDVSGRTLARCSGYQPVKSFVDFLKGALSTANATTGQPGSTAP